MTQFKEGFNVEKSRIFLLLLSALMIKLLIRLQNKIQVDRHRETDGAPL